MGLLRLWWDTVKVGLSEIQLGLSMVKDAYSKREDEAETRPVEP